MEEGKLRYEIMILDFDMSNYSSLRKQYINESCSNYKKYHKELKKLMKEKWPWMKGN